MSINLAASLKNQLLQHVVQLIDSGTTVTNPYIKIYTGSKPGSVQDSATGTLLATLTMSTPHAFHGISNAIATARTITDDSSIDATGTAGWFRIFNKNNVAVLDGDVSVLGSTGDLQFDSIQFVLGGAVQLPTLTLRCA